MLFQVFFVLERRQLQDHLYLRVVASHAVHKVTFRAELATPF